MTDSSTDADIIETILEIFRDQGNRHYGRERVTQTAHALQCATLAEKEGAPSSLIVAALLHDIGHLTNPDDKAAKHRGEDAFHETVGRDFLSPWFGPDVTEPVLWHVAAKRYLTATEPDYFASLSPGSVRSLELQGGPFTPERARAFAARPYAEGAIRVRRWDEGAKVLGLETPPLDHFRPHLEACLAER